MYLLTFLGVAIAGFAVWWAHLRRGRLVFVGHGAEPMKDRNILRLTFRVYNAGALTVHLKGLYLRQTHPKGSVLTGEIWSPLGPVQVDGLPVDIRHAALAFTGSESHLLKCDFLTLERTPLGNVGIAFVDVMAEEKSVFGERRRAVLCVQVSVGKEFKFAFEGSAEFLDHLRREKEGRT